MLNRTKKRLAKKAMGPRILNHPITKRMARNVKRHGEPATEVYRLNGDQPDEHRYFDVFSMREWAEANIAVVNMAFDWPTAEHLMKTGAVDPQRIGDHTIRNDLKPIILGRHAVRHGTDHILDGAHRYVALAMGATAIGKAGEVFPVPTYVLQPEDWSQFLIPLPIVKAFRFDDAY